MTGPQVIPRQLLQVHTLSETSVVNNDVGDTLSTGTSLTYGMEYSNSIGFKKIYNNYDNVYTAVSDTDDYYIFTPKEDGELSVKLDINNFNPGYPYQNGYITVWISDTPNGYNLKKIASADTNGSYTLDYKVTSGTSYYINIENYSGAWATYSFKTDFTADSTSENETDCSGNITSCNTSALCQNAGGYWYDNSCHTTVENSNSNSTGATLFSENFESYTSGSLINASGSKWNGDKIYVTNGSYMSGNVLNGRYDIGTDTMSIVYSELSRALTGEETVTMSFDAYATTDSPISHNQVIGLGVAEDAAKVFWNPAEEKVGSGMWRFDAHLLTGKASDYEDISGGYDTNVSMKIVVDGVNNEVYGVYNFGSGEHETTHYTVTEPDIEKLDAVYIYADFRSPTAASTQYGAAFSGIELDNILVVTDADTTSDTSDNLYSLSFNMLSSYAIGDTVDVILNVDNAISSKVDLYAAVELASGLGGGFLFFTGDPFMPLTEDVVSYKSDTLTQGESYKITSFELPEGIGGNYKFYAVAIEHGKAVTVDHLMSNVAYASVYFDN